MKFYIRLIFIGIVSLLLLSTCANVSRIERDSLVAYGELLEGSNEPLYYSIGIDVVKNVDKRILDSLLKLSKDAPPCLLGDLQPEFVAKVLPVFTPPSQWPDSWKRKAKEDDAYSGNGFHIKFNKQGRLLFVGICSHCAGERKYPIVGTPDGQKFYELPLTKEQFSVVFGSPTRMYKVNEVGY